MLKKIILIIITCFILTSCTPKGNRLPQRYLNDELVNLQNDDNDILESMYLSEFSLKYKEQYTFGFTLITKKELTFSDIFSYFFEIGTNYDLANYKVSINNTDVEYQFIRDYKLIKGRNLITFTRSSEEIEIASFTLGANGKIFSDAIFYFNLTRSNKK